MEIEIGKLIVQLFTILALFLSGTAQAPTQGKVVGVIDGDTITVNSNGKNYTVRLLGVDSPETSIQYMDSDEFMNLSQHCKRAYGLEAKQFTKNQVLGEQVRLEYDPTAGIRGMYDRYLAEVVYNSSSNKQVSLNLELLRSGLARYYSEGDMTPYRETEYSGMEQTAKWSKGIWKGCTTQTS